MRIRLDKIASSTVHLGLSRQVVVAPEVQAEAGAVVAVRLLDGGLDTTIENPQGRMMKCREGDVIAGVLGRREALRGFFGDIPASVAAGDVLHLLNRGGVIGLCPDGHPELGTPPRVQVLGSVVRFSDLERQHGEPANIFPGPVALADPGQNLGVPVVFVVGTTMHAGKTAAACAIVRGATVRGMAVVAAKVTGVALRRDTLEMQDYGAVSAVSFADVGFPSTINVDVVRGAWGCLVAAASRKPDLLVVELGDGLMGQYGVREVLSSPGIAKVTRAVVLSANDPVGAWGGQQILAEIGLPTTVITGPATDNDAGCTSIASRTAVPAINARRQRDAFVETVLDAIHRPQLKAAGDAS
ncbi:MAG: hypothetical protein AAGA48_09720 [Myxococcota bacterium]